MTADQQRLARAVEAAIELAQTLERIADHLGRRHYYANPKVAKRLSGEARAVLDRVQHITGYSSNRL